MGFNTTNLDLLVDENPNFVKLGLMAAKTALNNYELRFNTLVAFNLIQLVSIEVFFKNFDAVLVKRGKYVPVNRVNYVPQFVVFGQQSTELVDWLNWLIQNKYDNTAKFIIVCVSGNSAQCEEKYLVQSLGELSIANVVFLKLSNDGTPEAYTIYPVSPNKCWNKDPVRIKEVTYDCEGDNCYSNLFPEKFKNLYKCPFSVSTYEQPPYMVFENSSDDALEPSGSDGDILKLVISMLNGTLAIKIPAEHEWGHFGNNNWTGCLGDVYNNRAQGAMCSSPLNVNKFGNFQISFTYDSMDLVWGAPMPALKPSWEKLLYPLPVFLRIAMLCLFVVIIFMNTFTKTKIWSRIMNVLRSKPTRINLLLYSWIIFLGMPVVQLPRKFPFRLMLYTWIWYCTIIRSLYQATLVGSLKLPLYENKLENFSDVLAKKYPFGGQLTLREYFSEERDIYENWKVIPSSETQEMLGKISKGETDFVIAMNKQTIVAYLMKYHGSRQVQILPQKIVNSPSVMFFKKNSHICAPVSKLLTIYLEGGFSQRMYSEFARHLKRLLQQPTSHVSEPLRMQHFTGSFVVLIVGWLLGLIFYVIELACGRKWKQ